MIVIESLSSEATQPHLPLFLAGIRPRGGPGLPVHPLWKDIRTVYRARIPRPAKRQDAPVIELVDKDCEPIRSHAGIILYIIRVTSNYDGSEML